MSRPAKEEKFDVLVISDDVVEDKNTGKKTIINAFNQIWCSDFPNQHGKLVVLVSLTNGRGQVPLDLQFIKEATDAPLCGLKGVVNFPDPLSVVDVVLQITGLPLPEEGHYAFRLVVGGKILRERRVFARRHEGGK